MLIQIQGMPKIKTLTKAERKHRKEERARVYRDKWEHLTPASCIINIDSTLYSEIVTWLTSEQR